MKILLIGGCGFIGFNAFRYLKTKKKTDIFIIDNLSGESSQKNLQTLRKDYDKVKFEKLDVSNFLKISSLIKKFKPDAILALHGQVAVTKSIIDPRKDFNNNFLSIFNLLESIKLFCPKCILINLSSNKLYGKINNLNLVEQKKKYYSRELINEKYPLNFESPYACSKGAADQYILDYSKLFNIKAVSLRLSCVYGENQWGTEDQGWIAWFIKCLLNNKKIRLFGNGKQVRDVLHVYDLSRLIYILLNKINKVKGHAFNIGGGKNNSLSLLELIEKLEKKTKKKIKYFFFKQRFGDQKYFVNDLKKVTKMTGWRPKISADEGIKRYLNWIIKNQIKLK